MSDYYLAATWIVKAQYKWPIFLALNSRKRRVVHGSPRWALSSPRAGAAVVNPVSNVAAIIVQNESPIRCKSDDSILCQIVNNRNRIIEIFSVQFSLFFKPFILHFGLNRLTCMGP